MKWPFVTRRYHDYIVSELNYEIDDLESQLERKQPKKRPTVKKPAKPKKKTK